MPRSKDDSAREQQVAASGASALPDTARRGAIFTIVSCNYIAYAATLMQSVRRFHPDAARFIVLADAYREFPGLDTAADLIFCDDLGIALIANMQLWYTVIEFNTAIKPFVFRHLFERFGYDDIVYLDPDILLFRPLEHVFEGLVEHDIVLIPHMTQPLQDGKEPSDLTIMRSGVYNLGFLGVRNDPEARALIDWWSDRCYLHCRVDVANNMFTDQRWMDLAPAFVPNPLILRHPGYDVAYWNLAHRAVEQGGDGTWLVNGQPLAFFHFSGIDPEDPSVFSKHQNRFTTETLGPVAALCDLYRQLVLDNGWLTYSRIRYAYAAFSDGRRIEDAMRQWLRRAADNGLVDAAALVATNSRFFDLPDEAAAEKGVTVTRFMYQFWLSRDDLRTAFDIHTQRGYEGYFDWFLNGEAQRQGVDGRSIAAARRLRGVAEPERVPPPAVDAEPPWPSISRRCWEGPSREAARFIEGDVTAEIDGKQIVVPVQAALLWELRTDLRAHFGLATVDDLNVFLAWALTSGVNEGMVHPDELSPQFLQQMTQESSTSGYYRDVPITAGLAATRFVNSDNKCYEQRRRFPVERSGRLAHGLWFAFVAARQFRWPAELVAPLTAYFDAPSGVELDGYQLSNALLAIWDLRDDVQKVYPLDSADSIRGYIVWLLTFGLQEMNINPVQFGTAFRDFLLSESPRRPGLERLLDMIYEERSDLQEQFDIATEEGRTRLRIWWWNPAADTWDHQKVVALLVPTDAAEEEPDLPTHRAKVALTGQWSAPTGRGEDVRCTAASLQETGFNDFVIVDSETHKVLDSSGFALPQPCKLEVAVNILHLNADTAYADWRLMQKLHVAAQTSVGFWAWELERLPSYWRYAFSFFDEIWASTQFAEAAYTHANPRRVRLMPMAVIAPEATRNVSRRELDLPVDATVFLFVFDFRSFATRKNPEAVIRAFLQAFPAGDEKVFLVIKSMGAEENPARFERLSELCADPRISLRDVKLDRDELLGLIKSCDAFVSLHRSEGFGRGPAEAMLLARPTILTAYSGTNDYATAECAYLVDYELVPVHPDEYLGVEGQRWADANVATAARHMRTIYERPEEARKVGARGKEAIAHLLNPSVIGQRMHRALMELLDRSDPVSGLAGSVPRHGTAARRAKSSRQGRKRQARSRALPVS